MAKESNHVIYIVIETYRKIVFSDMRELIGGVVVGGDRVVMRDGFCEHERTVLGLFLVLIVVGVVGGAEVYAGAAFQRDEERRGYTRPHPIGHPIQLLA